MFNKIKEFFYTEDATGNESSEGYARLAAVYLVVHVLLEVLYIYLVCGPLIVINIFSIMIFAFAIILCNHNYERIALWLATIEVYVHVIMTTILLGYDSGFYFWLFAIVLSVVVPYFTPTNNRIGKFLKYSIIVLCVWTFYLLTWLDLKGFVITKYYPDERMALALHDLNAFILFTFIISYIGVSSFRNDIYHSKLKKKADTDYLTELHNRQFMSNYLQAVVESNNSVSVAIMDIDYFKKVNDEYGHAAGDYILKAVAHILAIRDDWVVGRWGGEEFMIVADEKATYEHFCQQLEMICHDIDAYDFEYEGKKIHITASFGSSNLQGGKNLSEMLKLADSRLYVAKESGRNRVVTETTK